MRVGSFPSLALFFCQQRWKVPLLPGMFHQDISFMTARLNLADRKQLCAYCEAYEASASHLESGCAVHETMHLGRAKT